jgi:hypothetical protein
MSHIAKRFLFAVVATLPFVLGGTVQSPEVNEPGIKQTPTIVATGVPRIDPLQLHGEIPNTKPMQRSTVLARGEMLGSNIRKLILEMRPVTSREDVENVVRMLLDDVRSETGTQNLDDLGPGASVTIFLKFNDKGDPIWDAYAGEYSGIGQVGT